MFKNKSIQVKLVEDAKSDLTDTPKHDPAEYVRLARETGKDVVVGAAVLIGTYVALDTLRQVTVKIVAAKV